jgi:hypothetical protein
MLLLHYLLFLHLPEPLILCDAYRLAGCTIAEHQGHSTKNQNLAFSAFLGKCQFLDLKRSSPKLGASPKLGSRLGPILIDQAWSQLFGPDPKQLIGFGWVWSEHRQNRVLNRDWWKSPNSCHHITTSPSRHTIETVWEAQVQLLVSSFAFYQ